MSRPWATKYPPTPLRTTSNAAGTELAFSWYATMYAPDAIDSSAARVVKARDTARSSVGAARILPRAVRLSVA